MGKSFGKDREKYDVSYNPNIALPLKFERIVNEYLASSIPIFSLIKVIKNIKKEVADIVRNVSLPQDSIHYSLKDLDLDGLLITNYDLILEKNF